MDKIKIQFEDFWHSNDLEEIVDNPIYKILSKRYELVLSDNPDFLVYSCFGNNYLKYNCIRIFYTGENVRPNFDECDYAFSFDYPVTKRNYRLPLYKLYPEFDDIRGGGVDTEAVLSENRKFCNFVYSNDKAKERIDFFTKLNNRKHVDSGGRVLNNIGRCVENKVDFLRQYKFTIAFENTSYPGYTTEKIMQPFVANSIPIYWGDPLVSQDFNSKAFINCHDYGSFDEVIDRVIEIDGNDELYKEYLSEPVFPENIESKCVNEDNIVNKFQEIFSNKKIDFVAKKTDVLKYYTEGVREKVLSIVPYRVSNIFRKK